MLLLCVTVFAIIITAAVYDNHRSTAKKHSSGSHMGPAFVVVVANTAFTYTIAIIPETIYYLVWTCGPFLKTGRYTEITGPFFKRQGSKQHSVVHLYNIYDTNITG